MEPKIDIFVMVPQMYFTHEEIEDAQDRLVDFAQIMHRNQDIGFFYPDDELDSNKSDIENAAILADILKKITEKKPDEIFTCCDAWDNREIRFIQDFAMFAGIKVVSFKSGHVIPDYRKKIHERNPEMEQCIPYYEE